jgi:hypothetical protein
MKTVGILIVALGAIGAAHAGEIVVIQWVGSLDIPDNGEYAGSEPVSSAPPGALVTAVSFEVLVDDRGVAANFWCSDYEIGLSSTARGGTGNYLRVWDNAGAQTDGGLDDDTADDSDIDLSRTTGVFNGQAVNQTWYASVKDNVSHAGIYKGLGYLKRVKLTIHFPSSLPAATTKAATGITGTSATLNGMLTNDGGEACQYQFRYKKEGGSYVYTGFTGSKRTGGSFGHTLAGLDPGTTYYFAAQAANSVGDSNWPASDLSFATLQRPTATTQAATDVTATTATLNGTVANDGGAVCQYRFRYKKEGGSYVYTDYTGSKRTGESFSHTLVGLDRGAIYYFAAQAANSVGESDWPAGDLGFTTPPVVPTATIQVATDVTPTTATLNGTLTDDGGAPCDCWFWISPQLGYWWRSGYYITSKRTGESFSETIIAVLDPGTTYYFTAQAKNSAGEGARSGVLSFTTPLAEPTVTTDKADKVASKTAILNGMVVDDGGAPCEYRFRYWKEGKADTYTDWTGSVTSGQSFSEVITGLNPDSVYYFAAQLRNSNLEGPWGSDVSFTTEPMKSDPLREAVVGSSLGKIDVNDAAQLDKRVQTNNFEHAMNPAYDRVHVARVEGMPPDPTGMMIMRNLRDADPASARYGEVVQARAKGAFNACDRSRVLVRFAYLFDGPGLQVEAYLSDVPELLDSGDARRAKHYVEIGRIAVPPQGRPGSIGSGRFGCFEQWVSTAGLDLSNGTWVELELVQEQTGTAFSYAGSVVSALAARGEGSVLIDDWTVEVHCDGICLDLNWSDTADEEDFLLVVASCGRSAGLLEGGVGSRYCLDGAFSSDGYVDSFDVHSWDWALNDTSRVACNYCRVPLPLATDSGTTSGLLPQTLSTGGLKPAGIGGQSSDLLVLGKSRMDKAFSDLLEDCYSLFDSTAAYQGYYTIAGLPDRCDMRVVRGPADNVYVVNTESGVLRIDGRVETVIPPGQTSVASDPRYGGPATVYIGIQGQGSNCFGRPVLDAAFDSAGNAYVVPVVVQPTGFEPYLAAARLQLGQSGNPPYRVVQLYDDPPLPADNQRRDYLREIEIDGADNVYLLNVHALNESCILWRYGADGVLKRRVDLMSPSSPVKIPDPIALHVSHDGQMLYLASGQRDLEMSDSTVLYGLSTQEFSLVQSVTIRNIEQVTSVTEDPATGDLWVVGMSMPEIPACPNPMDEPFYMPFLAKVPPQTGTVDAVCIADPDRYDLALPTSIVWVGASQ